MFHSSIGRWHHKIRKFAVKIFQNANNRPQTLRQILHMVTIDIAINSNGIAQQFALHPAVLHCFRGDAFGF